MELPDPIQRLNRDLASAAVTLSDVEARYLVDAYYAMQEQRKRTGNQITAMAKEPHMILDWLNAQSDTLESQIKRALDRYTDSKPVGQWLKSIYGIGPVISAGLLAHIDIKQAPTVGHIWRFAGLDPTSKWEKGQKRPWNAALKTLCWKAGQSFMKFSGSEECFYGHVYKERKETEIKRNLGGGNVAAAAIVLETKRIRKETEAYVWLAGCITVEAAKQIATAPAAERPAMLRHLKGEPGSGLAMLPPAQIDARARRYAVKLFLSHLQYVWYSIENGEPPPKPYILTVEGGHAHFIGPPGWPLVEGA